MLLKWLVGAYSILCFLLTRGMDYGVEGLDGLFWCSGGIGSHAVEVMVGCYGLELLGR
jgi:hypothetical protein